MPEIVDLTAWTSLLLGLAALFASIGALREPGIWGTMLEEIEGSPALQFVCGMMELVIGAFVYMANPWLPADLLSCVIKGLGGLMMIEALTILGFCDIYTQFWLSNLSNLHRGWALSTMLFGAVLLTVGAARFN